MKYRGAIKRRQQVQTLLEAAGPDERIHGHFKPMATDTGRFSSSDPNMQNISRGEIRRAFVAASGCQLIIADYSQIELRAAAVIAKDETMLAAYQSGEDIHTRTAASVLGKPKGLAAENIRKDYPCFVLAPQIKGKGDNDWFSASTQQKMKDIVSDLQAVDQDRRYVMGGSRGGIGVYSFISNDPDYFAAAVIICGRTVTYTDASKIKHLPIWAFHGEKDGTVRIDSNLALMKEMIKIGGNMKLTTYIGEGHKIGKYLYNDKGVRSKTDMSDPKTCNPEKFFVKWLFSYSSTDPDN